MPTTGRLSPMADPPEPTLRLESRIPAAAAGKELLDYLRERFRYHDREQWRRELTAGRVQLDGHAARGHELLRPGMRLAYERHHHEPAVDRRYRILHHDDDLVVVDKPAHLPMHADGPFVRNTLVHVLRTDLGLPDLQLAHRLDRETSGVCIVAANADVRRSLHDQFVAGTVGKLYHAVVHGRIESNFVVERPIGHAAASAIAIRRSAAPDAHGSKPARTRFEVLARGPRRTLLACRPETGRTHQIRVHLEAAGHAIVGDKLYGRPDDDYIQFVARMKAGGDVRGAQPGEPDRQLLHAAAVTIACPRTGAPRTFTADAPPVFAAWLHAEGDAP
jgi:23S rRNA pseudouridine1911/1915/1917 synthase